ncbi:ATP-binding protein [Paenibacillus sp. BR2-3]|uniref:ATP-binding protein n=1 Tax=Paenibacillus sp. BR2-3 TaxID=3048494 RepID=UPI003977734B
MENSAKDSSILDQVFMKSPLGMAVLTPNEGNWLKVNPALYHMLGYSEEEPHSQKITLKFHVVDTGIGIPPAKQNLLFHSFSQLHPTINRKYGGTGLGLAICKKLVELMGGAIAVESSEGEGSDFYFTLQSTLEDKEHSDPEERMEQQRQESC